MSCLRPGIQATNGLAMNSQVHFDITARLNQVKSEGLISDYWVSWVGSGGKLEPRVCSWTPHRDAISNVRTRLDVLLSDLVHTNNIVIRHDQ
jgi:hypothetical protein